MSLEADLRTALERVEKERKSHVVRRRRPTGEQRRAFEADLHACALRGGRFRGLEETRRAIARYEGTPHPPPSPPHPTPPPHPTIILLCAADPWEASGCARPRPLSAVPHGVQEMQAVLRGAAAGNVTRYFGGEGERSIPVMRREVGGFLRAVATRDVPRRRPGALRLGDYAMEEGEEELSKTCATTLQAYPGLVRLLDNAVRGEDPMPPKRQVGIVVEKEKSRPASRGTSRGGGSGVLTPSSTFRFGSVLERDEKVMEEMAVAAAVQEAKKVEKAAWEEAIGRLRSAWKREGSAAARNARPVVGRKPGELLHMGSTWTND
jgi:hypothetical protein